MDKSILTLDKGTRCTAWNYSGQRLVSGLDDGSLVIYDSTDPSSSTFSCTSRFKVRECSILKVVWVPPEYGDAVACVSADGSLSLWEEVVEDTEGHHWKMCKCFDRNTSQVLDVQFGDGQTCLKLVAAYSDGQIKIYELLDTLELEKWQLQAEFQNVIDLISKFGNVSCLSASISWNPQKSEGRQSSFVLGFSSNTPPLNSPKVWEFDLDHQKWLPVAELSLPEDKSDQVHAVSWAPNIGRPYELIAVATQKGISIWQLGSNPDPDGRLSVQRVALLSAHDSEVGQMEWDMSGMTLATTGSDGVVRLWQSNLNGVWHEQAVLAPTTLEEENMVRRRIEIKLIEDDAKRHTTFSKRRKGLEKKTKDLCRLCDAQGAMIVFSKAGNVYGCGNPTVDIIVDRYLALISDDGSEDPPHSDAVEEEAAPLTGMEKMIGEVMQNGRPAWEATVRNLGLSELAELEAAVKEIKRKVAAQAREVAASERRRDIPEAGI